MIDTLRLRITPNSSAFSAAASAPMSHSRLTIFIANAAVFLGRLCAMLRQQSSVFVSLCVLPAVIGCLWEAVRFTTQGQILRMKQQQDL